VTPAFTAAGDGTPEAAWQDSSLTSLPWTTFPSRNVDLVVVAPHPDDETLGAGGLIATARAAGATVTVVVATAGEASHPSSPTHGPGQLAARRRAELAAAVAALGPGIDVCPVGLPDGGVAGGIDELAAAIVSRLRGPAVVAAPWEQDGHPDHEAAAAAAREAVRGRDDCRLWQFPVWAWHWADPGSPAARESPLPWRRMRRLALPEPAAAAKRRAIACYASQQQPLSPRPGDEAVLRRSFIEHFRRPYETFVVEAAPAGGTAIFEHQWAESDDPWGTGSRWYERRKRRVLLASLPGERYGTAFEAGCGNGTLTVELASRCGRLLACDQVPRAVELARRRVGPLSHAHIEVRRLPGEWPGGPFDLIVLHEVGYYLEPAAVAAAVDRSLAPGGTVVACHWRRAAADHPYTAEAVHAAVGRGRHRLVRHDEADFILDVWGDDLMSVAAGEGLVAEGEREPDLGGARPAP
jgi:LmbE family N-acetylglucosaminyl deacetylase/SAM-dependent methyltransferase